MGELIACDIETGPIVDDELRAFFDEPVPPEFDPAAVKYGNAKKEETRQKIFDQAKADHAGLVANWGNVVADAFREFKGKAALSAVTGRVLAIGYASSAGVSVTFQQKGCDERLLLSTFWSTVEAAILGGNAIVFHNGFGFDLPFLCQRSFINDVTVPDSVFAIKGGSSFVNWNPIFRDTMDSWRLGGQRIKLDTLAAAVGVGRKADGMTGADFAAKFFGSEDDRAEAIEYLRQDCRLTLDVAKAIGIR